MSRVSKLLWALLLLAAPLPAQQFGAAVAISDGRIMIAEPANRRGPSTIYTYEQTGDGWEQVATMSAPPHGPDGDYFGRFFTMDDRSMVVGGTLFENSTGAVWVYRRDGDNLELESMLRPEVVEEGEAFGRFGQLYGNFLFVSSLGFGGVGAVWVFERDGSGPFVERAVLQPENPAESEFFGWGLSYNGERLIVGSFAGEAGTGAAYIFSQDSAGEWFQETRLALPAEESQPGDVGMPGAPGAGAIGVGWFQGTALLGLPGRNTTEGAVYTYTYRPLTDAWVRGTTLSAFDSRPGTFFGHGFHAVENDLWVSAPGTDFEGAIYRFTFDPNAGTFGSASKITNTLDPADGDGFGAAVATEGDLAIVGQPGNDGGFGSAVVMRHRGGNWVSEATLLIPSEPGLPPLVGGEIACNDSGEADQFGCSRVDILSFLPVDAIGGDRGTRVNDVWGWTDPETGREYALVGRTDGTAFIDLSDPINPVYLGNMPRTRGSQATTWRDVKVFDGHAFVVADGAGWHGMQVFDLTRLRDVSGGPATFEPDVLYEGFASAHNVAINEDTGIAYGLGASMGGETCGGGLHMIDINDPLRPTFLGCFQDMNTGRAGTGYTHDAMCIIYQGPDAEHAGKEICFGANETALSIGDVSDKANPVALSSASHPNVAYAHQGWITEDHRYFYLGDELDEGQARRGQAPAMRGSRTLIWDVSDLDDPILVKEHFGETLTTDHNLYIKGDLMYQSNYVSGLRILNISDPVNPVEVGFLDTVPSDESVSMRGSWSNYPFFESGTIVVTSTGEGVFFVRYRPREVL